MSDDTQRHDDATAGRVDRRRFLTGGLAVGGAIAAASIGAEAIADAADTSASARRRRRRASPRSEQPNILVSWSTRCARRAGSAGTAQRSTLPPNIARIARSGVSFARHYTASNDCTPARAALLTGLHTHQTGCMITGASTLDPGFPTWGTMLREQGYSTYWYGKWHLTHGDRRWHSFDGSRALERYGFAGGTFPSPNGAPGQGWHLDPKIAKQFEHFYNEAGGDGPWCTTVSFVNPHDIAWWWRWSRASAAEASAPGSITALPPNFETPEQMLAGRKPSVQLSLQETSAVSFGEVPFSGPGVTAAWLPFLDLYVKLQTEVDRQVGAVLATLHSRPSVASNTIVVFTSDHGEYGASHGLRGKGAGMYEEAIRVPLIVSDPTGKVGGVPNSVRHQLTSSVDFAPMLLTIAAGSAGWRLDPRYSHLSTRADIAAIVADPAAPGRDHALHATDEVLTEFALLPYAASAPLHVKGLVTRKAKYATYTHWRGRTQEPLARGEQAELYDFTTSAGYRELENLAGQSAEEEHLRAALEQATLEELQAPLPFTLVRAQQRGLEEYHRLAAAERTLSAVHRLHTVERVVRGIEQHLP